MDEIKQEDIEEFFQFLQGDIPVGMLVTEPAKPKLSARKAFTVIWFLQEKLRILPDKFELCSSCKEIFDSHDSGHTHETSGKFYCDSCYSGNN